MEKEQEEEDKKVYKDMTQKQEIHRKDRGERRKKKVAKRVSDGNW